MNDEQNTTSHNQHYVKCDTELIYLSVQLAIATQRLTHYYGTLPYARNRMLQIKLKRLVVNVATTQLRSIRDKQLDRQLQLPLGSWRCIRAALARGEGVRGVLAAQIGNQSKPIPHESNCQLPIQPHGNPGAAQDLPQTGLNSQELSVQEQVNAGLAAWTASVHLTETDVSQSTVAQIGQPSSPEASSTNTEGRAVLWKDDEKEPVLDETPLTLVPAKHGPRKKAVPVATWTNDAERERKAQEALGATLTPSGPQKPVESKETALPVNLTPGGEARLERLTLLEVKRFAVSGQARRENGEVVQVRLGKKWTAVGHQGMAKEIAPGRWEAVAGQG